MSFTYGNKVIVNGKEDNNTFENHQGIVVCIYSDIAGVCFMNRDGLSLHTLTNRLKNSCGYFVKKELLTKSIHKNLVDLRTLDRTKAYEIETYDGLNSIYYITRIENINRMIVSDYDTEKIVTIDRRFIKSLSESDIKPVECEDLHYYKVMTKGGIRLNIQYHDDKFYDIDHGVRIYSRDRVRRVIEEIPAGEAGKIMCSVFKDRIDMVIRSINLDIENKKETIKSYENSIKQNKISIKGLDAQLYIHTLNLANVNIEPLQFKEYENIESIIDIAGRIIIKTKPLRFIGKNYPGIEIIINKIEGNIITSGYHPHTSGSSICFGNYNPRIERLLSNMAYFEIVDIINEWLPIYNRNGVWRTPEYYTMCDHCKRVLASSELDYKQGTKQFCTNKCKEEYKKKNKKETENESSDSSNSVA